MSQQEDPQEQKKATPLQCKQWWEQVADFLAEFEQRAEKYMHEGDATEGWPVDPDTASEVLGALTSARVSADSMLGTYYRVTKQRLPHAAPQPAQSQRPQYAPHG